MCAVVAAAFIETSLEKGFPVFPQRWDLRIFRGLIIIYEPY